MSEEALAQAPPPDPEEPSGHTDHTHHHHRSSHRRKSRRKAVLYSFLSFSLAFVLSALSVCLVLRITVFSKDYMLDTMRKNSYYAMITAEWQTEMEALVDASGFDKAFADAFVKNYDVQRAVDSYVSAFYADKKTLIDTTSFKQQLYDAVDQYILEKNIAVSAQTRANIAYFINEAAEIYVNQISIPFFSTIANYIAATRPDLNMLLTVLVILALAIAAIIVFTNEFKHRRFKYLFLGTAGSCLTVVLLPTVVLASRILTKVNLVNRSLYNLFVSYFSGIMSYLLIGAGLLLAVSVLLLMLYLRSYRHARNASGR